MAQSSFHRHSSLEDITNEYLYLCHFGWEKCQPGHVYGPAIRSSLVIKGMKIAVELVVMPRWISTSL